MNEELRKAIEWIRGLGTIAFREYCTALADAAERSLAVDSGLAERITIRSLQAHIEELREKLREAESRTVDDAEVREAVVAVDNELAYNRNEHVQKYWKVVEAAALSQRTRWYTPEKDGHADESKWRVVFWRDIPPSLYHPGELILPDEDKHVRSYTYLDPPPVEEPLPKCWCGTRADTVHDGDGNWYVCCDLNAGHGETCATTKAEARENWRKLRGQP